MMRLTTMLLVGFLTMVVLAPIGRVLPSWLPLPSIPVLVTLYLALGIRGSHSAGAACASGSIEPSPVLVAMGRSPEQARASLRFSVGSGVDAEQIDFVLALLPDLVARARDAGDV